MIARFSLAPGYDVARIIKGGWHLAGDHGSIDAGRAIDDPEGDVYGLERDRGGPHGRIMKYALNA